VTRDEHLGYQDLRLYNGGWSRWDDALTLLLVEGVEPFDESFAL
jgi:thiosulfate/3-mercaptopyruvate sulfurtransferase